MLLPWTHLLIIDCRMGDVREADALLLEGEGDCTRPAATSRFECTKSMMVVGLETPVTSAVLSWRGAA